MQLRNTLNVSKLRAVCIECSLAVLGFENNLVTNKEKSIIVVRNCPLKTIEKYPRMNQKSPQVVKHLVKIDTQ